MCLRDQDHKSGTSGLFEDSVQRMLSYRASLFVVVFCLSDHVVLLAKSEGSKHFMNEWAVEIPGGLRVARDVADDHGFSLVREIESLADHYLLERREAPHRTRRSASLHTRKLTGDSRVLFAAQQLLLSREKRNKGDHLDAREVVTGDGHLDDPEFLQEWYLNPFVSKEKRWDARTTDLRVREVWKMGITGKNVVATILDDGIEKNNPDLINNYDPLASTDLNDHDDDPTPRYDPTNENKHGTRCAGVISMMANNNICGAGIAFDSKIGGVRMLDGNVTDSLEAASISFRPQHIDIYSASWGPSDNGKVVDGPRTLARKAIHKGVTEGRGGKGSLYVWASGNGGHKGDNCNADGYASAIETISVSSSSEDGRIPYYAELCASTLTTAYSSGNAMEGKVVSTDLRQKCTNMHSGTSAAAPMVAGIIALLLEINPNVTWRDVQHILVHTSRMEPLAGTRGWYQNGAGYCVNLAFGFGLVDALSVVELGNPRTWRNVEQQKICRIYPIDTVGFPFKFKSGQHVEIKFTTDACAGGKDEVNYLEHVQVVVDVEHERRGSVYAEVESAMGTVTPLMLERPQDTSKKGFYRWALMSVHSWGENPRGIWRLRVADRSNRNLKGLLKSARIVFHGTKLPPEYRNTWPQNCIGLAA